MSANDFSGVQSCTGPVMFFSTMAARYGGDVWVVDVDPMGFRRRHLLLRLAPSEENASSERGHPGEELTPPELAYHRALVSPFWPSPEGTEHAQETGRHRRFRRP